MVRHCTTILSLLMCACAVCDPVPGKGPQGSAGTLLDLDAVSIADVQDPTTGEFRLNPYAPINEGVELSAFHLGVIDSGVLRDHPQLKGVVLEEKDFTGEGVEDRLGHGTLVAILAVHGQGDVAQEELKLPGLLVAKVAHQTGRVERRDVVDAIEWLCAKEATLVNMSLGFFGGNAENRDLCRAIERCEGTLFTAAAGNFGTGIQVYPAACGTENIIVAGALDATGHPAGYSGEADVYVPEPHGFVSKAQYEENARLARGIRAAGNGDLTEARILLEQVSEETVLPAAQFQLALIDLAQGQTNAGISRLRRSLELGGPNPEVLANLGGALLIGGDPEEALRYLEDAHRLDSNNPRILNNLAICRVRLGQLRRGLETFRELRTIDPDYPDIDTRIQEVEQLRDRYGDDTKAE